MIERCPRSIYARIQKESFILLILSGFLRAAYWDYIPYTVILSPVLPWFFHGVEIFGIHNHFLEPQMPPPLESSGSSDIESLFRSGYFHKIPGVSLKNFWKCTGACSLWHGCISLYADSLYSLHIHTPLLPIHSHFYFSAFAFPTSMDKNSVVCPAASFKKQDYFL